MKPKGDAMTGPEPHEPHNYMCEHAADAQCRCFCHGAGHQQHLVRRAVGCASTADRDGLVENLEAVYGGFRDGVRDITVRSRCGRWHPDAETVAAMSLDVRRGATWLETVLVDEGLHAAFIAVSLQSLALSDGDRVSRVRFVDRLSQGGVDAMPDNMPCLRSEDAHVWCSVTAEFLSVGMDAAARYFSNIAYPRRRRGKTPNHIATLRPAALARIGAEFDSTRDLDDPDKRTLLQLVGAASCPDLWRHAAAVRACLAPFVESTAWPPSGTTSVACEPLFGTLRSRWGARGNW